MTSGAKTIIIPVSDLARAKPFYSTLLGAEPVVDGEFYVGFHVAGQDIGLDPSGPSRGMTGPVSYWHVEDINKAQQSLLDAGAQEHQPVSDVGGGKLVASVKDADGNLVGLIQMP